MLAFERPERLAMTDDRKLTQDLALASYRLTRTLQGQTRGGALTGAQIAAMATIVHHGHIVARDLAALQQVTPATISRLLAELAAGGMIRRSADEEDSRLQWIEATHVGAAIVAQENARRMDPLVAALRALSPADRETLARAVTVIEKLTVEIAQAA